MERNKLLDCLKGFGCILVIFMHIPFPGILGEIIHETGQIAVPVFIMTSGYYAFGSTKDTIKKRTINMIKIFLFSLTCFFVYNCLKHIIEGDLGHWISKIVTFQAFIKCIVFCTIDYAIPLWYLVAMIETYCLWQCVVSFDLEKKMEKCIPIFFLFQFVLTSICETLSVDWFWKTNFISNSVSFFTLGYYFHHAEVNKKFYLVLGHILMEVIVGYILTLIPVLVTLPIDISCLGIAMYSIGFFQLAIAYPQKTFGHKIEYIGNKLSLDVYIFHTLVAGVIGILLGFFINTDDIVFLWVKPILVAVLTISFAEILYRLKERHLLPKWV